MVFKAITLLYKVILSQVNEISVYTNDLLIARPVDLQSRAYECATASPTPKLSDKDMFGVTFQKCYYDDIGKLQINFCATILHCKGLLGRGQPGRRK